MLDLKASVAARLAPPTARQRLDVALEEEPASSGGARDHLTGLLEAQQRALRRLATPSMHDAVEAAAEVVAWSGRVAVHAHGVSLGIATYAAAQLARIGLDARVLGSAAGLTGDDLHQVQAGDAVIVIASGRQRSWHEALYERCTEQGAGVVLLTDTQPTPLRDAVVLRTGRGGDSVVATHVSTVAAVEQILVAVAARDRESATATLAELDRHRRRLAP
jgi:DNA-binding MurR/RpiR family transcriptional regulator